MEKSESKIGSKPIKALICQLNPQFKKKKENLERVAKSLEMYGAKD